MCLLRGQTFLQPETALDVVKMLLEKFVQDVPTSAHRMALEACALVRLTSRHCLARMLAKEADVRLFEWLRGLSFHQIRPSGSVSHDLTRKF